MINKLYIALHCCLILAFSQTFAGEFSYRGEIGINLNGTTSFIQVSTEGQNNARTQNTHLVFGLRTHIEAEYMFNSDLSAFLVLDPSVSTDGVNKDLTFDEGLTELYALYRLGEIDITAGLERLPLETARLNAPFSLATKEEQNPANDPKGFFKGVWGVRAAWYPGDYRFRGGLYSKKECVHDIIYKGENFVEDCLNAVVSVRRNFGEFELEVHGVYSDNFNFGLGGSGLIGDIVIYGESWLLLNAPRSITPKQINLLAVNKSKTGATNETAIRAVLGATGYWEDVLWTSEVAYLPSPIPIPGINSSRPFFQLAGQVQIPFGAELNNFTITSRLGLLENDIAGLISVDLNLPTDDVNTTVSLNSQLTSKLIAISFGIDIAGFF